MNNQDFDRLLNSIRETEPDPGTLEAAAGRVRGRLDSASLPDLCAEFRAEFAARRTGSLSEARRMLLEDHLHACPACRVEYSGVHKPAVVIPIRKPAVRRTMWAAAGVAAMVALTFAAMPVLDRTFAPSGPRATVDSLEGTLVAVSGEGAMELAPGASIEEGQEIRTGRNSRAVIRLRDGSRVEMAAASDLSLTELWRSKTVHLTRGSVMVEAAKQVSGRLEVLTADCLVTVKGTIFGVSRGLKGSRISVVEGAVEVEQNGGTALLKPGDQAVTHESIARTAVSADVSWSQNAAKYLALLAELNAVQQEIARIPLPGLRYSSRLLDRVPAGTTVVGAIPNLSQTLAEATRVLDDHARRSPVLAEFWNGQASAVREVLDHVREISDYLGDEIILTMPVDGEPMLLAEVRRQGLAERLTQLGVPVPVGFDGSVVAINAAAVPPVGPFQTTPFGARIAESYRAGAGLLLAVDMEQIVADAVGTSSVDQTVSIVGADNLKFLVGESKTNLGAQELTASLTFAGPRKGIASWLATPGPMGTLEFVSPEASFAASFLSRDPRLLLEELVAAAGQEATSFVNTFQGHTNLNLLDDLAGTLGGEAAIALDGALLPVPAWKLAVEVENPSRLQTSLETVVNAVRTNEPGAPISLTSEAVNGRTFYTLALPPPVPTVHYTYVDGYLLAGASRPLLISAITNRAAALTLPRSTRFRDQLPLDGRQNFSGVLYYNLGASLGPLVDQLKQSGLLPPEEQASVDAMVANREPSLIYVYADPDRVTAGSRSGLLDVGLQAMTALTTGNPMMFLPTAALGGTQ